MAGLTSLPRKKNIKGQPHKLAYITEAESDLLKSRGGAGKPVKGTKGVPAYFDAGEGMGGYGSGMDDDATGGAGDPSASQGVGAGLDEAEPTNIQGYLDAYGITDPGIQASYEDYMDDVYSKVPGFKSRAQEYTDFFGAFNPSTGRVSQGRVGLPEGYLDSTRFSNLMEMQEKFGYAPPNVVSDSYGQPVTTTFGYLTFGDPETEPYTLKRYRDPLLVKRRLEREFSNKDVPSLELLRDPVLQDVMSPSPSIENRRAYTQAVREASQAMTPEQRYGVLDPKIDRDDPRFGTRVGGYLQTLEQANLPTYMGGFRGSRETEAPFALTKEESDRYQDIFMAFAGTRGEAIRTEIDNAKSGQTVQEALSNAGFSSFGLPKEAEVSALSNYMDREALKGWVQGLGIVTSMNSPFMPATAMGLPQEIYEDTIKPAFKSLRESLDESIPGFKDLSAKFDVGVEKVEEQYEKQVPETETIVDTIFDALFGKGKSQEAKEFGSSYQVPSSVRESREVTVEDIAPVSTAISEVPTSQFPDIEPMMLYDPIASQMQEAPVTLDEAIAFGQSLERDRDLTEQVNRQLEETVFLDPLTFPYPERPLELPPIPETIAEALQDQRGREASIARDAALQNIPVELPAPISPVQVAPLGASAVAVPEAERAVEIEQLAPLPEEVDIAQAAFTEPPVVETVSEISPDAMNAALSRIGKMAQDPESPVTIDDYRAVENARTTEEFVEAIQIVLDKEEKSGVAAKAEKGSGFTYKRGN